MYFFYFIFSYFIILNTEKFIKFINFFGIYQIFIFSFFLTDSIFIILLQFSTLLY